MNTTTGSELEAAQRAIIDLHAEVDRLRARTEDDRVGTELRLRLAQVGAASHLSMPAEHGELLEQIVRTAMHVLHARAGSLYSLDENSDELVFEVALGDRAAPLRGQRLPLNQGMAGWVAVTGQAIAVADVQQDPRWAMEIGRTVGYAPRTMLTMPLLLRDRVIGVLQLMDKDGGEPYSAGDMATLGLFAQQAAVAIAQSHLVCSLSALLQAVLADLDQQGDLAARAAVLAARTEETAEYRDTLRLAGVLAEIARHGEAGRRLSLEMAGVMLNYVRSQSRVA